MKRHTTETVQDILNKLKILGFYKGALDEDTINIFSDAWADLDDVYLLAGYNFYKKHGADLKGGFSSSQFFTICRQSLGRRPEYESSKPVETTGEAINAREWIRRVKAREVQSIKHLTEAEQALKYKIYEQVIEDKSGMLRALTGQQDKLLQLKERIKLAEKYLENPEFFMKPDAIKKKAEAKYIELLNELDRLQEVAA